MFYETLLQQRPDSEMAQDWCLAYGILDADQAQELYEKVQSRKGKAGSPVKKSQPAPKSRGIAETKASLQDSDVDAKSDDDEEEDEKEEETKPAKSKRAASKDKKKKSAVAGKKRRRSGKSDDSDEHEDEEEELDE